MKIYDGKRNIIILLSLLLFLFVGGCSQKKKKDTIMMWLVGSENQAQTINELGKSFFEKTGVKVDCQAISWGSAHSKYLTSIAGDVVPDIGTMGITWGMEFGELGAMVDLRKAFPEDVGSLKRNIFAGIWKSLEHDGKIYGIPFDVSFQVLFYRSDIIESVPDDWQELIKTLEDLNKQAKGMIFDWGSMNWIGYSPFLWQAGGEYYNDDYSASTVDSQEAQDGLKYFTDLYRVYKVPKTPIPVEQGMRTADYPLAISGNWKIVSLTVGAPEILGKWSIAPLPKGPAGKRTAFMGGRIMGIFSKSKMKNEAWKFIKFLNKPENQVKMYVESERKQDAYLPPNIRTWDRLPMKKEYKDVLERQARNAEGPPPVLSWDTSATHMNEAIQEVILKNADIKEVLKKAKQQIDKELKDKN